MARPIKYWLDIMFVEKASMATLNTWEPNINSTQELLNALTSTSRVSIFALLFWCIAACAVALDTIFELTILTMTGLAAKARTGSVPWYPVMAKEFQYGDELVQNAAGEWVYETIDTSKQIIKLAAAKEGVGVLNLKVAALSGNTAIKLTTPQYDAFKEYAKKRKPGGINLNVISDDPDELRLYMKIFFNPLVLKSNGESILNPGTFPVEDAINDYLKIFNSDGTFDGKLDLMKLTVSVKSVIGVESAFVTFASGRYGTNDFVEFNDTYLSNAGHMAIDALTPLSGTLTYEQYV